MNNFTAAEGDSKGEINLQWESVENAVTYIIEIFDLKKKKSGGWKIQDIITDPSYTVKKLKSYKNYSFRITSVDENGQTIKSKKINIAAP